MTPRRILDLLHLALSIAIGAGFLFALALNFSNVIMRYVFLAPIYWAEEVMIFTFVWCVFLGAAAVTLSGDHLRVEFLQWMLPPRSRKILASAIHLVAAILMAFVTWRAFTLFEMIARLQQKSIIAEIPMYVPYGAVLVGSALLSLASFVRAVEIATGSGREEAAPAIERGR